MTEVITVRVSKDLKDELEKRGVNISVLVRRALENGLKRLGEEEFKEPLESLENFWKKSVKIGF